MTLLSLGHGPDPEKCPRCEQTKDRDEFYKARKSKDGRATYCKQCSKEKQREWKDKNREHVRQQNRQWHRDNRESSLARKAQYREDLRREVFGHYCGNSDKPFCQCCGENILVFLSIDHINGGGRQHREEIGKLGGSEFLFWIRGLPEGYQVLCRNCNWGRFANGGVCPHRRRRTDR